MGGVAGHLSHVHEDLDLTFGEIKSLLSDVASAKIEAVEKFDGQNIFFKFFVDPESGELKTARNVGDVKTGGMSEEEFMEMFRGHGAEAPFVNGFEAINRGLSRMDAATLKSIFTGEHGQRFVNAEIIYPDHPNIINYSSDNIVMHNLQEFDENGAVIDIQLRGGDFEKLVNAITSAAAKDDSESWGFYGPQIVKLRDINETGAHAELVTKLDALGMSDSDTLADYVEKRLRWAVLKPLNLSDEKTEDLVTRIVGIGLDEQPLSELPQLGPLKKGLPKDVQKKVSSIASKQNAKKLISVLLGPVENIINDFAIEVLRGMESFLVDDTDAEVKRMKKELNSAIAKLQAVEGEEAEKIGALLDKQLPKLGDIEDRVNSSMEGVIFEHPPGSKKLYKLTGAFAMVNQIIGRARRIPSTEEQNENLLRSYVQSILMG